MSVIWELTQRHANWTLRFWIEYYYVFTWYVTSNELKSYIENFKFIIYSHNDDIFDAIIF